MQTRNTLFTCGLPNGRGGKIWRTGEERSLVSRGRCVPVAAPGRRELNDSWRKGWSLVSCFCFCALWSGALLLSADGGRNSAAGIENSSTSEQLVTSKVELVRSKPVEEAVKTEKSEAGAAVLAAAEDSQQRAQKKDQSTTAAGANLNDVTTSASGTPTEEQEHPNPKEDDVKPGEPDVTAAAAAAAAESHIEKRAQRTKKGKECHGPTHSPTESRIEGGQSKQTQEGVGSRELKVKAGTAAAAKDSDQEQKEGWEEVETKTPTPAAALRGFTTSKETLEGGSSASTGAAVSASAVANDVGGPDVTNQCTRTDAHTIFWRAKVKSSSVKSPLFTNNADDSTEGLGLYGPINPFFETVLSCGRSALAEKGLTEVCIQARLEQLQREPLTEGCVACFAESVSCGANHCRSSCFLDSCAEKCLQCTSEHCRPALERCAGLGQLPPICVPEEATTSQEEEEEKADESRHQKAWNTFFHSFAETEEESH